MTETRGLRDTRWERRVSGAVDVDAVGFFTPGAGKQYPKFRPEDTEGLEVMNRFGT